MPGGKYVRVIANAHDVCDNEERDPEEEFIESDGEELNVSYSRKKNVNENLLHRPERMEKAVFTTSNQQEQQLSDVTVPPWLTPRVELSQGSNNLETHDSSQVYPPVNCELNGVGSNQIFEIATDLNNVSINKRAKLLYLLLGDELQGLVTAAKLCPSFLDSQCYSTLTQNISTYLRSLVDTTAEHEEFTRLKQESNESVVTFYARVVEKAGMCGYGNDENRFIRSQILQGMSNRDVANAARTYNHDTQSVIQAATRAEAFNINAGPSKVVGIMEVTSKPSKQQSEQKRFSSGGWNVQDRGFSNGPPNNRKYSYNKFVGKRNRCFRCDCPKHNGKQCPALFKNCNTCNERGHFSATCRKRRVNSLGSSIEVDESIHNKQMVNSLSLSDVLLNCYVGSSKPISFLIDSGADVNVIGGSDWESLEMQVRYGSANLEFTECTVHPDLRAYAADLPMSVTKIFWAKVEVEGLNKPVVRAKFLVIPKGRRSLLGRETASDLKLLLIGQAVNCSEQSEDVKIFPKVPGIKVKFSIDRTVPPVRNAYFNVPAAFREAAKVRLEEMEARGIIEKVTTAPEWISGMSAVPKGKDDFRLVVNMRAPNKAIKREYFRLPLLNEMKTKLHGARYFTKLDLTSAYYHLELSQESRELTTFLAERGMYRFTRLMFGVNCAPEIFQREMTRILEGIFNVIVYIDDILIFADTLEHLRKTVANVLKALRANNLTLNTDKCEFDRERIKFLGHELDKNGFHVDDAKVANIRNFREPSTVSELRSFLGLASFVSSYIKNFADLTSPLWKVATSHTWQWGPDQTKAFEDTKNMISNSTIALGYFSGSDRTVLYTDASPVALGAVLTQEGNDGTKRIISFASKALTSTEKKYAQNQREALGAVWAVEYFSFFLLGRHFILQTDARGVSFILNRSREDSKRALTRADGWALRLSPYSYEVEFIRGRDNIADPSSRLYGGVAEPFNEDVSPWEIACLEANSVSFLTEDEICEATEQDETLKKVLNALKYGEWPKELNRFISVRNELCIRNRIILKGGRAVIPESLQEKALSVAHEGHPLAAKLKSILRERVWWPGVAGDAEMWVKACRSCAVNGKPEKPTPMMRTIIPKTAWETIALDFNGPYAKFGSIYILVIVDYRSRYIIARPVKSTSFEHTKKVLEEIFEREGFPDSMKSDNGPPFNGEDYSRFCHERGIKTIFSTPNFPQQNGMVENYMKIINKSMAVAAAMGLDYNAELQAAVHAHNAASHTITKVPPEEIMCGRRIKRGLPLFNRGIPDNDNSEINERDRKMKLKSKEREDNRRGARNCQLKPGDNVIIQRQQRAKGDSRFGTQRYTILEERNGCLILCDDEGRTIKRHVSQTKKVFEWRDQSALKDASEQGHTNDKRIPRSVRNKKVPNHLKDFVRIVGDR
ncbi:uncharacterized protein K02A2.6-like [Toxorhynchites rutilus septentrionalis]|uniref:uncharacterized protein K02A2.6-like n=1 Tax=Toxorhynchites rutilus septentrionalis TaxID=329112 RepID=UPI0024792B63|nr:uncharacterized protein K02A2.6-like [Toxorhynchites rutilus septentrionalis]